MYAGLLQRGQCSTGTIVISTTVVATHHHGSGSHPHISALNGMQLHRASVASQTPASVPRSHGAHVCVPRSGVTSCTGVRCGAPVRPPCCGEKKCIWGPVRILYMSPDGFYWGLMWSARMRPFCGDTSCIGVRCLRKNSRRLIPPCQLLLPSEPIQVTLVSDKREFWSCEKNSRLCAASCR